MDGYLCCILVSRGHQFFVGRSVLHIVAHKGNLIHESTVIIGESAAAI